MSLRSLGISSIPLALLLSFGLGEKDGRCHYNLDEKPEKMAPMILDEHGDIIYPSEGRILTFNDGDKLDLFCHSTHKKKSYIKAVEEAKDNQHLLLRCKKSKFLKPSGKRLPKPESVMCSGRGSAFEPLIVKHLNESELCSDLGADGRRGNLSGLVNTVQIGWNITGYGFREQIRLCFDDKVYGTLWTKHNVLPNIQFKDIKGKRPRFRSDTYKMRRFYGGKSSSFLTRKYRLKSQVAMIKRALGTEDKFRDGSQIISSTTRQTNFFAKGHLSPDAAFIYDFEQEATYFFINVAPQFQAFNNGNWKALEIQTRTLAIRKNRTIQVFSGTSSLLSYPDKNGTERDIYLWKAKIPVPLYYWKVLYDEEANEAVGFLGMNDPHSEDVTSFLCNNICQDIKWVDWQVDVERKGHMSCCKVENLRKVVSTVPDLRDNEGEWPGLMKNEN